MKYPPSSALAVWSMYNLSTASVNELFFTVYLHSFCFLCNRPHPLKDDPFVCSKGKTSTMSSVSDTIEREIEFDESTEIGII